MFALPGDGPLEITIGEPMVVTDQVSVQGDTQPGSDGTRPLITVQGSVEVPNLFVLEGNGPGADPRVGSTIQGLTMMFYAESAVSIRPTSTGNFVQNNWLGFTLNDAGAVIRTNAFHGFPAFRIAGVEVVSSFNTVRGNSINGNYDGVVLGEPVADVWSGQLYQTNSVQGNTIGVAPSGTTGTGYGNQSDGILVVAGAQKNFVGPNNTVSNNGGNGVALLSPLANLNVVVGNRIGTNAVGDAPLGNIGYGVLVGNNAAGNLVGGPLGGNVISANARGGVALGTAEFPGAQGYTVRDNIIGLNATQTAVVGMQNVGIRTQTFAPQSGFFSRPSVTFNVVAGHALHGIYVEAPGFVLVQSNWLGRSAFGDNFANGGFGVVLMPSANQNTVLGNLNGVNTLGNLYVDPFSAFNFISGNM